MSIKNSLGLSVDFLENGAIRCIDVDPVRISIRPSTLFSRYGTNIYLRRRSNPIEFTALIGPESISQFQITKNGYFAKGSWKGIDYFCTLRLSKRSLSWEWIIELSSDSDNHGEYDLVYLQDVGMKPVNSGLINEYYVSQYIERIILEDERFGPVICCRQNMKESVGNPWLMIACSNGALSASTDGMQFYGTSFRESGIPEGLMAEKLGGEYAGESSVVAIQQKPFRIEKGKTHKSSFIAKYLPDHPLATSRDDLKMLHQIVTDFDHHVPKPTAKGWKNSRRNLFNTAQFLKSEELSETELTHFFGKERRHLEKENGKILSFFGENNNHIVLKNKEILVDRPHAHIMQAKTGLVPDETIVSTNPYAYGVFNSHISQGNTNFNVLLSVCSSQFNLAIETGQRIFVKIENEFFLLGVPSAFEMGLNHCRWIYKFGNQCFQIRSWTSLSTPQVNMDFGVLQGEAVDLLITHDFDPLNGWRIYPGAAKNEFLAKPKPGSIITSKFPNAQFRVIVQSNEVDFQPCNDNALFTESKTSSDSLFILDVRKTTSFCISFIGEVNSKSEEIRIENTDNQFNTDCKIANSQWRSFSLGLKFTGKDNDLKAIEEILPWYGMNALIHYLTPYGLEQFSGAAWGTRDVSQGPIELLLNLGKYDEAKKVLCVVFSNQHSDGGWPQWWMFDSYSHIRAHEAHGDIMYWCIIALGNYIKVTGDLKILDEALPYFPKNEKSKPKKTLLSEHVERLIRMIVDSFIPGTALVPFGGGDWNDSLQPVNRDLAQRMISSWTVEMNYQAFRNYQKVYELSGELEKAKDLELICQRIKADFNRYLIKDGLVAGYGLVEKDGNISIMLHPQDKTTGIRYSVLPMNRGIISELFTKEQAEFHQQIIEEYLKGPDGVRLMDRPLKYKGGIQNIFQRAESSTFFGREIGLMYVHEHIRYAESLAITGKPEAFVKALRQAIPVSYNEVVPCGDRRQANCYYSSSDVVFKSRYEADERYDEINTGNITLRGGWRVYSSGPGIYIGLIISRLLGIRVEYGNVIIDPVMPKSFNGLKVQMDFMGFSLTLLYFIKDKGFSPTRIIVNGKSINYLLEENKYRDGGAIIPMNQFLNIINKQENRVEIYL
jgi:cellobiose phosphorylase